MKPTKAAKLAAAAAAIAAAATKKANLSAAANKAWLTRRALAANNQLTSGACASPSESALLAWETRRNFDPSAPSNSAKLAWQTRRAKQAAAAAAAAPSPKVAKKSA